MDEVEEIKRHIDIVDLVSSYLTLKKAGANYRAVCPFHNEKTPSLMISPEKQIFKCFGCNEGGDVFSFVMKMENLEFYEALQMLSERTGVELKPRKNVSPGEKPDRKSRLFQINNLSAKFFNKLLVDHPSGKQALEYLKKRGLKSETLQEFMIGHAPSSRATAMWLKKKGFAETEIKSAGSPDKFFKRIIFPIRDVMGNTIGFTGRVLEKEREPKYLNTPETIIFQKGRILFNLDKARREIKEKSYTVVVEGQMDVISSYQAGVKNVVATSGTALTEDHLKILYRYSPNIIFAFDSDGAGLKTAKKAYEMAIVESFNVKMVELGEFKDPGEVIEKDPKLWQKIVADAKSIIDWYFDLLIKGREELGSDEKREIAKEILPVIAKCPNEVVKGEWVNKVAKRLEVKEQFIYDALEKVEKAKIATIINNKKTDFHAFALEDAFTVLLVKNPQEFKGNNINPEYFDSKLAKIVYTAFLNWYNINEKGSFFDYLKTELSKKDFAELQLLILEVEEKYGELKTDEILQRLKSKQLERKKENFALEIKKAETTKDYVRLKNLIKEFQDAIK